MTQDMPLQDSNEEEWEEPEVNDPNNMVVTIGKHSFCMHFILKGNLDNCKKEVLRRDLDAFFVLDGLEGFGKSTLAMQVALYCDPTFCLDRVCFTIEQFIEAVDKAKKGQAIVFDETMGYLASRGSMSKFNRKLIKIFSEMRSKNLFIFLCIPSFFELDRYPAIHRSVSLLHVHKRGVFVAYNYSKKKLLYIKGKKYYAYNEVSGDFIGNYSRYFPLDKAEYEKKKQAGIKEFYDEKEKVAMARKQRNLLINHLLENKLLNYKEIGAIIGISPNHVLDLVRKINSHSYSEGELEEDNKLFGLAKNSQTDIPNNSEIIDTPPIIKQVIAGEKSL